MQNNCYGNYEEVRIESKFGHILNKKKEYDKYKKELNNLKNKVEKIESNLF